jgi:hypothetical protein
MILLFWLNCIVCWEKVYVSLDKGVCLLEIPDGHEQCFDFKMRLIAFSIQFVCTYIEIYKWSISMVWWYCCTFLHLCAFAQIRSVKLECSSLFWTKKHYKHYIKMFIYLYEVYLWRNVCSTFLHVSNILISSLLYT